MKSRTARISARVIAAVSVAVLVFAAVPAFAFEGPVLNDCTVGGVQLQGMTEADARATIASESAVPTFTPLVVQARTRVFTYAPTLDLDVETMLAAAYATTTPAGTEIPVAYTIHYPSVSYWVSCVARLSYKAPVNARYYVSGSTLRVRKAAAGWRVNQTATRALVESAFASACAGSVVGTVTVTSETVLPSVTGANMGKAILIDISQRRLRVFKVRSVIRSYRVAVGTGGHPTPRGNFRVIKKVKNPAWYNPGSAWAAGMPSYIAPGPSNPLGTRALYLNAPGIRIHGTSKRSSIGTAASHGCIRMLRENIEALYPIIAVGTPVFIVR